MKLTDDQKKVVTAKTNILVAASAGTGKTSTMIERVIFLLLTEKVDISEILFLVFNETNARELKLKIYDAICAKLNEVKKENLDIEKKLLMRALSNLPYSNIYTIHSFSAKVTREHFSELNISPNFSILDENDSNLTEIISNVLDEKGKEEDNAVFIDLIKLFSTRANAVNQILKLYNSLCEQASFKGSIEEIKNKTVDILFKESLDIILEHFNTAFKRLRSWALKAHKIVIDYYEQSTIKTKDSLKYLDYVDSVCKPFINGIKFKTFSDLIQHNIEFLRHLPKFKDEIGDELVFAIAEAYKDDIRDKIKDIKKSKKDKSDVDLKNEISDVMKYTKLILNILLNVHDEYSNFKRRRKLMSYSDLQIFCLEALKLYPNYGIQFKHIFVDEYQDLNHIQEEIITKLSKNNLFVVGDVKQSIYRFRHAEPKIFLNRKKKYELANTEQVIYLKQNFRSSNKVLDFVNRIFESEMTEDISEVDYNKEKFILKDDTVNNDDVTCILYEESKGEEIDNSVSKYIAEQIKDFIDQGYKYSDIVILTRKNIYNESLCNNLKILSVFDEYKIPYNTISNKDRKNELTEIISFLNAINNPHKDIYLFTYLTSIFSKLTEKDLYIITNAVDARKNQLRENLDINSLTSLYDRLSLLRIMRDQKNENNEYNKVVDAYRDKIYQRIETLKEYRLISVSCSPTELINMIVAKYHYDSYLKSKSSEGYLLLNRLIELSSKFNSLNEFLTELQKTNLILGKQSADSNAVEFATVHSYKGLEKPIVFAVSLKSKGANETGDIFLSGKELFAIKSSDKSTRQKNDNLTTYAYRYLKSDNEFKDELRLLYVQLTRSKNSTNGLSNKLILVHQGKIEDINKSNQRQIGANIVLYEASIKKSLTIFPKQFNGIINNAYSLNDLGISFYVAQSINNASEQIKITRNNIQISNNLKTEIEKIGNFEYQYKDAINSAIHYSVSEISGENNDDGVRLAYIKGLVILGSLYHKVLEKIDFSAKTIKEVDRQITTMINIRILDKEEAETINRKYILNVINCPIIQENISKGSILEREKRISSAMSVSQLDEKSRCDDLTLVDGIADLIIKNDEDYIILDYKLSRPKDDELLEKYKKQLSLYQKILEKEYSEKVTKKCLIYINTGQVEFFD